MAEYIERSVILQKQTTMTEYDEGGWAAEAKVVRVEDIEKAPAADVAPVVHGRWVDRYGGKYANHMYECSECKGKALYKIEVDVLGKEWVVQALSATCPNCGAIMDGDE